jgi:hypothetical protein
MPSAAKTGYPVPLALLSTGFPAFAVDGGHPVSQSDLYVPVGCLQGHGSLTAIMFAPIT